MKKLLALLLLATPLWATSTPRLGIDQCSDGLNPWGNCVRSNYTIIDSSVAILSSTQTFTAAQTFQSTVTFSTFTVSQIKVSTPSYTGTDRIAVNGTIRAGGGVSGGAIYACNPNFERCVSMTPGSLEISNTTNSESVFIRPDGTINPVLQLAGTSIDGIQAIGTTTNLPAPFSSESLLIGPTYGDRVTNILDEFNDRSAIETPVYIGTHTVSGTPMFAIKGDTGSTYSVLIGTSPTLSATNYHFRISTMGVTTISNLVATGFSSGVGQLLNAGSTSSGTITISNTYLAAGPSQAITLTKATNKVTITVGMDVFTRANTATNTLGVEFTIMRDGTTNLAASGSRLAHFIVNNDDNNKISTVAFTGIDTPGDLSSHTYQGYTRVHTTFAGGNGALIAPWITSNITVQEVPQ